MRDEGFFRIWSSFPGTFCEFRRTDLGSAHERTLEYVKLWETARVTIKRHLRLGLLLSKPLSSNLSPPGSGCHWLLGVAVGGGGRGTGPALLHRSGKAERKPGVATHAGVELTSNSGRRDSLRVDQGRSRGLEVVEFNWHYCQLKGPVDRTYPSGDPAIYTIWATPPVPKTRKNKSFSKTAEALAIHRSDTSLRSAQY
jgi:hypothetical protein